MVQRLFYGLYLLIGFVFMTPSALGGIDAVPFQTLHTSKGFKILFSETKEQPFTLSIAFKQANDPSQINPQILGELMASLLEARVRLYLHDQSSLAFSYYVSPYFFNGDLFIIKFKIFPFSRERLDSFLVVIKRCLEELRSISVPTLKAEVIQKIEALKMKWKRIQDDYTPQELAMYDVKWTQFASEISELKRIRAQDLTRYATHFTQDNLFIGATGDIEAKRLLIQAIDQHFESLPKQFIHEKSRNRVTKTTRVASKIYFVAKNTPYSVLSFGVPWMEQPYLDELATELLWEYLDQLICAAIQEDGALALKGVNPYDYTPYHHPFLMMMRFYAGDPMEIGVLKIPPEAVSMTRDLIERCVRKVQNQGMTLAQFKALKQLLIERSRKMWGERDLKNDADYLVYLQRLPKASLENRILTLNALDKDTVNRVAREHLHPAAFYWVEEGKTRHLS